MPNEYTNMVTLTILGFVFNVYIINYSFKYVTKKHLGYSLAFAISLLAMLLNGFFTIFITGGQINAIIDLTITFALFALAIKLITKATYSTSCLVAITTTALSVISLMIVSFFILLFMCFTGMPRP